MLRLRPRDSVGDFPWIMNVAGPRYKARNPIIYTSTLQINHMRLTRASQSVTAEKDNLIKKQTNRQ